jgi:hypothetical protein
VETPGSEDMSTRAGSQQHQNANNIMNARYRRDASHFRDVNNRKDINNGGNENSEVKQ